MGFCVHHEERDEFLALYEDDKYMTNKVWSITPELALLFDDQLESEALAKKINDGSVGAILFDKGSTIHAFIP